jgi:hypothetical protein
METLLALQNIYAAKVYYTPWGRITDNFSVGYQVLFPT